MAHCRHCHQHMEQIGDFYAGDDDDVYWCPSCGALLYRRPQRDERWRVPKQAAAATKDKGST